MKSKEGNAEFVLPSSWIFLELSEISGLFNMLT